MLISITGHLCAVAVGITLGLLGGGGSILAVPILIYIIGVGTKEAIAISLVSVGVVSVIGAIFHGLEGRIRVDIALMFAPAAMVGAYLGAYIASFPWISEAFQLICFSVIMLLVSFLMLAKSRRHPHRALILDTGAFTLKHSLLYKALHKVMIPAEGLGIGLLTGFVGIGGGFAIVPALVLLTEIPMKQAVGTSLVIIALKSVTGFVGYLGQVDIHWQLALSFTLAASLGTLLGTYLNRFVNADVLQTGFGYFVLLFAIFMLVTQFFF